MPHLETCHTDQRRLFRQACANAGLDKSNLSVVSVLNSVFAVIFGVFTSDIFRNVSSDVPSNKLRQVTIFLICVNLIVFVALRQFIESRFCFQMYLHSVDWFRVVIAVSHNLKLFSMFLVTSFVTSAFLREWLHSHFSAIETVSAVLILFAVINFVQIVTTKVSSLPPVPEDD